MWQRQLVTTPVATLRNIPCESLQTLSVCVDVYQLWVELYRLNDVSFVFVTGTVFFAVQPSTAVYQECRWCHWSTVCHVAFLSTAGVTQSKRASTNASTKWRLTLCVWLCARDVLHQWRIIGGIACMEMKVAEKLITLTLGEWTACDRLTAGLVPLTQFMYRVISAWRIGGGGATNHPAPFNFVAYSLIYF